MAGPAGSACASAELSGCTCPLFLRRRAGAWMAKTLQLGAKLGTRIRGMEFADYVVSLLYKHLPRLCIIRAERRSAQKSARRRRHKGADRRRGGRCLVERLLHKADQSLRHQMKATTVGKIHSRRQPTKQAKSAPWIGRTAILPGRSMAFSVKRCRKRGFFVIKKGVFEKQSETKARYSSFSKRKQKRKPVGDNAGRS